MFLIFEKKTLLIDGNFDIVIRPGMSLYDGTRKNHLFVSFVHVFLYPIIERPSVGWIFTTHIHQLAMPYSKLTHDTRTTHFLMKMHRVLHHWS